MKRKLAQKSLSEEEGGDDRSQAVSLKNTKTENSSFVRIQNQDSLFSKFHINNLKIHHHRVLIH